MPKAKTTAVTRVQAKIKKLGATLKKAEAELKAALRKEEASKNRAARLEAKKTKKAKKIKKNKSRKPAVKQEGVKKLIKKKQVAALKNPE